MLTCGLADFKGRRMLLLNIREGDVSLLALLVLAVGAEGPFDFNLKRVC